MAKNNNLGDLLTSIANAIRTKKGTQAQINAQNFDTEILSISGDSGSTVFFTGDSIYSTDTVTMTRNGQTYSGVYNADYGGTGLSGFIVSGLELGTYNYSYTQGINVQTGTITIDSTGLFTVHINFVLYLYNEGDECETITGGWTTYKTGDTGSTGSSSATKYLDYIDMQATYNSTGWFKNIQLQTVNTISTTGFTKLVIDTTIINKNGYGRALLGASPQQNSNRYPTYTLSTGSATIVSENETKYTNIGSNQRTTFTVDISNQTSLYVSSNAQAGGSGVNYCGYENKSPIRFYIHKIWLE